QLTARSLTVTTMGLPITSSVIPICVRDLVPDLSSHPLRSAANHEYLPKEYHRDHSFCLGLSRRNIDFLSFSQDQWRHLCRLRIFLVLYFVLDCLSSDSTARMDRKDKERPEIGRPNL